MNSSIARIVTGSLTVVACAIALSAAPAATATNGRIVFNNDEWTLGTLGFVAPNDAATFVLNMIEWTAGPGPKHLLIFSDNFGLVDTQLLATLTGAGHTYTQTTNVAELANLASYDVVLTTGVTIDNQTLINYVENGGNVYLEVGTGLRTDFQFDTFANHFGIGITHAYNGIDGAIAISSPHPIFANVDHLYQFNGCSLIDLTPNDDAEVLVTLNGAGLYAAYAPSDCANSPDLDGNDHVDTADLAILLGAWGTSDCAADLDHNGDVNATDLAILLGAWS